ncbi:MAG: SDR family NAD(P)-dependent oxidoreductase [Bacteroidota bacterium]
MKNVLITGINKGLGKALFELFLAKDYYVFGVLRNESAAEELKANLPENGKLIVADLSNDASIESIQAVVQNGPIDLLINNAGISGEAFTLDKVESDELLDLFNIHCLGVLRTTKSVKVNLLAASDPLVINLNSRFGSITRQSNGTHHDLDVSYSYSVAKAAQNMLTNCLRKEFKNSIKFISLHPGKMKTDIAQTDADTEPQTVASSILEYYEHEKFKEENGIVEIGKELIEW